MAVFLDIDNLGELISAFIETHSGRKTNNIVLIPKVPITNITITTNQLRINNTVVNIHSGYWYDTIAYNPTYKKLIECIGSLFLDITHEEKEQIKIAICANGLSIDLVDFHWYFNKIVLTHSPYIDSWR